MVSSRQATMSVNIFEKYVLQLGDTEKGLTQSVHWYFITSLVACWETQRRVSSILSTDILYPQPVDLSLAQLKVRYSQQGQHPDFHVCWLSCLWYFPSKILLAQPTSCPWGFSKESSEGKAWDWTGAKPLEFIYNCYH